MEKIALLGTFPKDGVALMEAACRGKYELISCTKPEEVPLAKGAAYVVLRGIPIGPAELDILGPEGKLDHRWGVGYDTVDVEEAGQASTPRRWRSWRSC